MGNNITLITGLILLSFMNPVKKMDRVVINELFYDPIGIDSGCFIELIGPPGLSLNGYYLIGINGGNGQQYFLIDLNGYKIPQDGFFVVAQDESVINADMINTGADLQNGPDNLELWFEDKKMDSVGYGDFSNAIFTGEGSPALDLTGCSIGRRPDGLDTNNNSVDFVGLKNPSPGMPNSPIDVVINKKSIKTWGKLKYGNL